MLGPGFDPHWTLTLVELYLIHRHILPYKEHVGSFQFPEQVEERLELILIICFLKNQYNVVTEPGLISAPKLKRGRAHPDCLQNPHCQCPLYILVK